MKKEQPLVSVVIPTYNHKRFVVEAIESVLVQTYPWFEVIVVDDGSTDYTKEALQKYGNKIHYIYQENQGLSAARNTGIRAAQGEFIGFLDADDIWLPQKLEKQMNIIMQSESIGIVGCSFFVIDEEGKYISQSIKKNCLHKASFLHHLYIENTVSGGSGALVRAICFEKVGFFDVNLNSSEDWDMWIRIAKFYSISLLDDILLKIRGRRDSMSASINAGRMLKNELKVISKTFENENLLKKLIWKRRAYSERYYRAAVAYREVGNKRETAKKLFRSLLLIPINLFRKKYLSILSIC